MTKLPRIKEVVTHQSDTDERPYLVTIDGFTKTIWARDIRELSKQWPMISRLLKRKAANEKLLMSEVTT